MSIRAVLFDWGGTLVRDDTVRPVEPCDAVAAFATRDLGIDIDGAALDRAMTAVMPEYAPGESIVPPHIDSLMGSAFTLRGVAGSWLCVPTVGGRCCRLSPRLQESSPVYCISCGTRLPDDASFCSSCGRATHRPDSSEALAPATTSPAAAAATTPVPVDALGYTAPGARTTARNWSEAFDLPYLHEGRWYARGPSGEVLVWDDQHGNWDLALSTQTPFFMRRPRFHSLRTPAIWIYVMIGFFALFCVLAIASDAEQAYIGSEIDDGREFTQAELEEANSVAGAMRGLQVLAIVAAAPLFVWWAYRGTKNLAALGAETIDIRPGWAIAWWFIPVANFVQPARVLNQLWKASHPDLPLHPTDEWRRRSEDFLTVAWWPACVLLYFIWNVVLYQWDARDMDDPARGAWALGLVAVDVLLVAIAMVGIVVIVRLTRRLHLANARFDPPAVLPATAVPGVAEAST